jgi:type I restriction enzyme S subunit
MSWRNITLGEAITLQRGHDLPEQQRRPGTIPVLGSAGINGYHDSAKADGPGVVIGRSGASFGKAHYTPRAYWPHNTVLYVKDFKDNHPRFVYYLLDSIDFTAFNSGSAQPSLNRNYLYSLGIRFPSLPVQTKIATILSAYNDLIENNLRRIKILEEMAKTLYEEWFVKFRFPDHEKVKMVESELGMIPEEWEVKNLFDIAEITYGFPFKSNRFTSEKASNTPVIRIRDILNGCTSTYTPEIAQEKHVVINGDILVGMDGNFHMGKWSGGKAYLNQRVVRFRLSGLSSYFLYLALTKPIGDLNNTIVGTTVAHLGDNHLRKIKILCPNSVLLKRTKEVFDPIYNLELKLKLRNDNLRQTRDLLLPKLISGEIDVEHLDINTGDPNEPDI